MALNDILDGIESEQGSNVDRIVSTRVTADDYRRLRRAEKKFKISMAALLRVMIENGLADLESKDARPANKGR